MNEFEKLAANLTKSLRADTEVRMDVANELRAHLEDTAAELRLTGFSEQNATEQAIKALGDLEDLQRQLWDANRRRIRIRQAVKWAARVTLIPAALVVLSVLGRSQDFSKYYDVNFILSGGMPPSSPILRNLAEDQRFLLTGDPAAKTTLERMKSISQRWPDDPVFQAVYVNALLDDIYLYRFEDNRSTRPTSWDQDLTDQVMGRTPPWD